MKGGSSKIILMAVIYLVIAVVMFLIFGPFSKNAQSNTSDTISYSKEERIIGNVGYESENGSGSYGYNYSDSDDKGNGGDSNTAGGNSDTSGNAGGSGNSGASGDATAGGEGGNSDGSGTAGSSDVSGTAGGSDNSGGGSGSDQTIHYYKFKVINIDSTLRVRDKGSFSGKVIARFKNGREGYVLEKGAEWSYIVTKEGTFTGYCYNDYLQFTEISKEEFLQDYVDQVK